ncbi:MAG TPA: ABC transporter ATP-binding protein [Acidisoma sp.]|jgi:peptide/nickel transport system ATP-binding protein|uniref:ABC transporter ATP-binding protein n=1 Tax=Acidisoma sp. TaxID=1872115 RepID=UPI002B6B6E0F|nr:ABC transporter ATP-binding protein [Acidisoma sp.]HTI00185.1 ABC transporter ATP-binding protein [Acidisoma sp.]
MSEQMTKPKSMLQAAGLSKTFRLGSRFRAGGIQHLQALKDVSVEVQTGEILGLVGESGCGKSTLGRCLLRLYDIDDGRITFKDRDISHLSQRELRPLRADMQMVFQDPYSSLNPRRRVRDLIAEPLRVHGRHSERDVQARLRELMELVNLSPDFLSRFPHEFSGGQRQRIGIARAIALSPSLIVADEPVSALDVSVQAQIVNLFMDLQEKLGLTYVFIAHDLSVVRQIATRTAVMYLGSIVELGETDEVLHRPAHPYTAALISAVPEADASGRIKARTILKGEPPSPTNPPPGCRFHTRCPIAQERCRVEVPRLMPLGHNRSVACHFPLQGSAGHA